MSDEEKKAIDKLKTLIQYLSVWKENFTIVPDDVKYLIPILNLIEKQQKEIEELKEKNRHITKETVEFVNSHYISKDRIKAKTEEYKKQQKEEPDAYLCIKVLRSLLEKE